MKNNYLFNCRLYRKRIITIMHRILVSKSLNIPRDRKLLLKHFFKYCVRALKLKEKYKVLIADERREYGIETTAVYSESDHTVAIYGKGRAFVDILRSLAHELVHAKQHEFGLKFGHNFLHFNNDMEDEANAVAGEILNAYTEVMGHDRIYENP